MNENNPRLSMDCDVKMLVCDSNGKSDTVKNKGRVNVR